MALKAVLKSLDGLDDVQRAFYAEGEDGMFYLDIEDVDSHRAVKSLKTAFEKQKIAAQKLRTEAAKWEGKDPDKYDELIEAAEEAERKAQTAGDKDSDAAKIRADAVAATERKFKPLLDKTNAELEEYRAAVRKLAVDNALSEAIDKAGVRKEYRPAVRALMRDQKLDVVKVDGEFRGVFKTATGDEDIGEYVETWAKSEEASFYMPADRRTGSGAPAGGGVVGGIKTIPANDPLAFGQNIEGIAKGTVRVAS